MAPDPADSARSAANNCLYLENALQRRQLLSAWFENRLKKLDLDSIQTHQRLDQQRAEGEVRSSVHGVVVDIRRIVAQAASTSRLSSGGSDGESAGVQHESVE